MKRSSRSVLLVAALVATLLPLAGGASADDSTVSYDSLRTGWDPHEPNLNSATVAASDYGQLFATQLDGQVYAQPLVVNGTLLVATENDKVYGLDPVDGAIRWTRDIGPAWPAGAIGCGDLVPNIGVTGTPVYDPASNTAYFTAKVDDGPDQQHPHWYLHAINVTTGAERANFPVTIQGTPSNSPGNPFNPYTAMQRPGLLLLDGRVYAAFASHCDHGPYVGYVIGWDKTTGQRTGMFSTAAGSSDGAAGIWHAGGGIVSDGPGRMFVTTGNGLSPPPAPGTSPPANLAESVIRLGVAADGTISSKDFFSPVNNTNLDLDDADLGSGGPLAIPDGYGTAAHPHLLVEIGKDGRLFLLDRDALGGTGQAPGGGDNALQIGGPYNGVWGHPAFWGGGSGYVYLIGNGGQMLAFRLGVTGGGLPALTQVGASVSTWGYTSGSPVVTSDGTTPGSALVWAVYSSGPDGSNGQLRAYSAEPNGSGTLALKYSAPIGRAAKFSVAATEAGRVYVGNRDGKVFGFGRPVEAALNGQPTDFGTVDVGKSTNRTAVLTASRDVTVTGVSAAAPFTAHPPTLPVTLHAGDTLSVPTTFAPTTPGSQSAALTVTADAGTFAFDLHGQATKRGVAAAPGSLTFGEVPIGGQVTLGVNVTNTSRVSETVTAVRAARGQFSTSGLPAVGSTLASGASVSVAVTFRPTRTGAVTGNFIVKTDTGGVTVPLTGTGVSGAPHLTITPLQNPYGAVPVGRSVTKSFDIENTGNLVLTITKAAPPAGDFDAPSPVSEGQQLSPGQVIHQSVTFTPSVVGQRSGTYLITGNDGQGQQTVNFTGRGTGAPIDYPGPAAGDWTVNGSAVRTGGDTVLTDDGGNEAGSAVSPTAIDPVGAQISFTAEIGDGTGADGMAFALLDATTSSPTSLGDTGGALGFDGLTGVAATLDTYQNGGDPNANFTGIGASDGTGVGQVRYAATRRLPTPLTTGTHTVDVTVERNRLTAVVDGTYRVSAAVAVPARAYLAFTAGTGGLTDVHTVRDVTITRLPPTGAITGVAALCATRATVAGSHAVVSARTCTGSTAQSWTAQGDGSLTTSDLCLGPVGEATADGTAVEIAPCDASTAQVWTPLANGTVRNSASNRCLSVPDTATSGTKIRIATCNPSATGQQWTLPD